MERREIRFDGWHVDFASGEISKDGLTHRLQDLFRVCDRIAVMYEGTKVAERRVKDTSLEELVQLIVGEQHR